MQKSVKFLLVALVIATNVFVFAFSANATQPGGGGPIPGLKGSIKGVMACHCPDDASNCYCAS